LERQTKPPGKDYNMLGFGKPIIHVVEPRRKNWNAMGEHAIGQPWFRTVFPHTAFYTNDSCPRPGFCAPTLEGRKRKMNKNNRVDRVGHQQDSTRNKTKQRKSLPDTISRGVLYRYICICKIYLKIIQKLDVNVSGHII
jgi:hypothetical protein